VAVLSDYQHNIFLPYLQSILNKVQRIDVVFDVYYPDSVKTLTREKRGIGSRAKVTAGSKVPSNWHEFLRVDDNKRELFHFLADTDVDIAGKTVIMTREDGIKSSGLQVDLTSIEPCNHEEADTRIMLHCLHAARCGSQRFCIRTVDTDIVVLALSCFHRLCVSELWIHFGVGKNVRLIPIHELSAAIGPSKCSALPAFHALTGCDTASYLYGKGKRSAWSAWDAYPVLTETLIKFNDVTDNIDSSLLSVLERFVVILYDRTSDCTSLNKARQQLFTKKCRTLENLPPTSDAFELHLKRVIYQATHCWSHCLEKQLPFHDPAKWGWSRDENKLAPVWMTLPEVSHTCRELIHCSCKVACTSRCKCVKANLPCTGLCCCDGECVRS